jgi:hypothetical protein
MQLKVDDVGRILEATENFLERSGFTRDELIGDYVQNLVDESAFDSEMLNDLSEGINKFIGLAEGKTADMITELSLKREKIIAKMTAHKLSKGYNVTVEEEKKEGG